MHSELQQRIGTPCASLHLQQEHTTLFLLVFDLLSCQRGSLFGVGHCISRHFDDEAALSACVLSKEEDKQRLHVQVQEAVNPFAHIMRGLLVLRGKLITVEVLLQLVLVLDASISGPLFVD